MVTKDHTYKYTVVCKSLSTPNRLTYFVNSWTQKKQTILKNIFLQMFMHSYFLFDKFKQTKTII